MSEKKITLFCCAGMSTSMLVSKMKDYCAKNGKEYDNNAYSLADVDKKAADSDVILIGPQVRYALKSIHDKFPEIPIDTIEMRMYGLMDAKGVVELAEKMLK